MDTYAHQYDPRNPVAGMDLQPVQPTKMTLTPLPATREPAATGGLRIQTGWHGERVPRLLRTKYQIAQQVILACDYLITHTLGAFKESRELVRRLELRHAADAWMLAKHRRE